MQKKYSSLLLFFLAAIFLRSLFGSQISLIDESIYTDCNLSLSTEYDMQVWQRYDIATASAIEFLDCINICANKADEVYYVLGLFGKDDILRRKIEIPNAHQRLYFTINLFQVDRWNIPEQFQISVDGKTIFTWSFVGPVIGLTKRDYCGQAGSLAVEQDQIITANFNIEHTTNLVEIAIQTSILGKGQWSISSFKMDADPCVSGVCLDGKEITYSLSALEQGEQIGDVYRLTVFLDFDSQIQFLKGTLSDRIKAQISDGLDLSLYSISMSIENEKRVQILIDLQTSIRNRYLNVSFPMSEYIRYTSNNFTLINNQTSSVKLPIVYYSSSNTLSLSASIAVIVKYFGIILNASLVPMIILRQFDVVAYTYFSYQMIYYYGTASVRMPVNVETFFASFDVFSFSFLPNLFDQLIEDSHYNKLDGFNRIPIFLSNAGQLFGVLAVIILMYLLCKVLAVSRVFSKYTRLQNVMKRINQHVFEWNIFLEYAMLCVMHVLFAFFIQFLSLSQIAVDGIAIVSALVSLVSITVLVGGLVYAGMIMYRNKKEIQANSESIIEVEQKYGVLWKNCKREHFWTQTCFYVSLMVRRVIFIFTICFVSNYVYTQFNILSSLNVIVIFIVASFHPMSEQRMNWKIILTECELLVIQTLIQILRSDDSEDEGIRIKIGWYIIVVTLVLVLMHCGFIVNEIIRYAKIWFVFQSEKASEYRRILDEKLAAPISEKKSPIKAKDEEAIRLVNTNGKNLQQTMSPPPRVPFIQGLSESFDVFPTTTRFQSITNENNHILGGVSSPRSRRQSYPVQSEVFSPKVGMLNFSPLRQQMNSPRGIKESPQNRNFKRQQAPPPSSQFRPSIIARDIKPNYDGVFQRQPTKQVSFISSVPSIPLPREDSTVKQIGGDAQIENRSLGNYIHFQKKQDIAFSGVEDSNHSLGKYIQQPKEQSQDPPLRRKRTDVNSVQLRNEEQQSITNEDNQQIVPRSNRRRTIIHQQKSSVVDLGINSQAEYVPSVMDSADNLRRRRTGLMQSQSSIRVDSGAEEKESTENQVDDFDFKGFRQKKGINSKLNQSGSNASIQLPEDEPASEPDNFDFKGFRQKRVSAVQRQNSIHSSNKQGTTSLDAPPNLFNPFEFRSSNTLKARQRINKDTQLQAMVKTESPEKPLEKQQTNRLDRRKRNGFSSQTSIKSIETIEGATTGKDAELSAVTAGIGQKKRSRNVSAMFADEIDIPTRNRNTSIDVNAAKTGAENVEDKSVHNNEEEIQEVKKKKKKTKGVRVDALQLQNIMTQDNNNN